MMDAGLALSSLMYFAIAYPFLQTCFAGSLNDPKKRLNGLLIASVGLAFGLLVKMQHDVSTSLGPNLYSVLNVRRHAGPFEIRKAYKVMAHTYHPDKNRDANAQGVFEDVQSAYDILMDDTMRESYNRFGPGYLEFDPRKDELKLLTDMAAPLVFWGVAGFVMTSSPGAKAARNWIAMAGIALFAVEAAFYLTEATVPVWMVPNTLTEHEVVFYLQSALPAIIALLCALSISLYVDIDQTIDAVLREVLDHEKAVLGVLDQVEILATIAAKVDVTAEDVDTAESTRGKLMEARERMDKSTSELSRRVLDLKSSSANPGAQYHWLLFVLMYGGVYFFQ